MLKTFLISALLFTVVKCDVFDQLTQETRKIINDSLIPGAEIRQCTCEEQSECVKEMKTQAFECVDTCWDKFGSISSKPDELKKCFSDRDDLMDSVLDCFEHNVDSCLAKHEDKKIQPVDIDKMFTLGVERINKTSAKMTKTLSGSIRKIVDTVGEFGLCVKDCFVAKNKPEGYCFTRKDCQPSIADKKARKTLKTCTKQIDFKKEAGELCECTVKAGLNELSQYCPMLKLIGQRGGRKG
ncbi:unnamed protein product [Bursaphelenchus okinawaensis]|uniref:Uncharacterized protein n=1 Tax=Bursaphelenchus okinawaensis TaxID=465554 RepID=A0A811KSX4_9BILA|nr:unnamed protein product [Bursaphelenchus okinawaensis]CAG9112097.1 unnamed protein product [Bursaphelenchus okinawaensis]